MAFLGASNCKETKLSIHWLQGGPRMYHCVTQVIFHRKAQLLVDDLLERFADDDSLPGMSFPDEEQLTADSGALHT